jgi:hypothetical protein
MMSVLLLKGHGVNCSEIARITAGQKHRSSSLSLVRFFQQEGLTNKCVARKRGEVCWCLQHGVLDVST